MYTNRNCKILNQHFEDNYVNAFTQLYFKVIYGESMTLGSSLVNDNE